MLGAGDDGPPQAASQRKLRAAPEADFLKPIISIPFIRERKTECVYSLDTPDSTLWMGCRGLGKRRSEPDNEFEYRSQIVFGVQDETTG